MYGLYLGALIKELRERLGMTQEELAGDFCAVSTLQRIEKGEEIPGRRLINQLFSVLNGEEYPAADEFEFTEADKNRPYIVHKIQEKLFSNNYDYEVLLSEYADYGEMDDLDEQAYLYYLALLKKHNDATLDEVFFILTKAAALTIKSRRDDFLPTRNLLTATEARVVRKIAMIYYSKGKKELALEFMRYFDRFYTRGICEKELMLYEKPMIYYYLTLWEKEAKNFDRCAKAAEKGVSACVQCGAITPLPYLYDSMFSSLSILNQQATTEHQKLGAIVLRHIPFVEVQDIL